LYEIKRVTWWKTNYLDSYFCVWSEILNLDKYDLLKLLDGYVNRMDMLIVLI
jgi:hypothetical protein